MNINIWLKKFKEYWQNHDIESILGLFDQKVIYFETPSIKLESFEKLTKEWEVIKNQNNIFLDFQIFASFENKHSIIWKLKYNGKEGIEKNFSGTYLIELNDAGKCVYFLQSCESI